MHEELERDYKLVEDVELERDRKVIEQTVIDGYVFWLTTGIPGCCHNLDYDGVRYWWATAVLNSEGQPAGTSGMPKPETVTETVIITERPDPVLVCKMGPREIKALIKASLVS